MPTSALYYQTWTSTWYHEGSRGSHQSASPPWGLECPGEHAINLCVQLFAFGLFEWSRKKSISGNMLVVWPHGPIMKFSKMNLFDMIASLALLFMEMEQWWRGMMSEVISSEGRLQLWLHARLLRHGHLRRFLKTSLIKNFRLIYHKESKRRTISG